VKTDVTVVLLVLGAIWVGMFNVVSVVEIKNGKRDRVLGLSEGKALTAAQKKLILWNDYITLEIGIVCFLLLFSGCFAVLPAIFQAKGAPMASLEALGCYGAAAFGALALVLEAVSSASEIHTMTAYIHGLP